MHPSKQVVNNPYVTYNIYIYLLGDVPYTTGLCICDLCMYSGHFEDGDRNLTQLDEYHPDILFESWGVILGGHL